MEESEEQELGPSELGTLNYWQKSYEIEIKNFEARGDPGEIWFGEDISERIVNWMNRSNLIRKENKILDIGCGNGMLLIELANDNYSNLTGIDYSVNAIDLAKAIAKKHKLDVKYEVGDILKDPLGNFDVIIDKGTYDAISLSEEAKVDRMRYIENLYESISENTIFIITSCNWSLEELKEHFKNKFVLLEVIPTPQFKFGGKTGSVVTLAVFKKKL